MPNCIHYPLAASPDGQHCSACGYKWRAPYFLRRVIAVWDRSVAADEQKRAAKAAKGQSVEITPAVAALFTDDLPQIGQVWKCEKCHRAPRRHPDFANNWKWKTEKGYLQHKCLGNN